LMTTSQIRSLAALLPISIAASINLLFFTF